MSAAVSSVLLSIITPLQIAFLISFVVIAHELGHYFTALYRGGIPELPVFIPFGIGILGITKVHSIELAHVPMVSWAGPIVGGLVALSAVLLALLIKSPVLFVGGLGAMVCELFAATVGADGRHARSARRGQLTKGMRWSTL